MKIKIAAAIIGAECIAIALLGMHVYTKYMQASSVSISPIHKEAITFNEESELEHFFELAPYPADAYVPPWLPYRPEFTINSDTLNDRYEYSIAKPESTYRIITLGDSWTFGQFVSTRDNFSELLEDSLNKDLQCPGFQKFEVLNLGVPNYDIRYSVERFRVRGQKYNPDLVLWFLIQSDFEEIQDFVAQRASSYMKEMQEQGELTLEEQNKYSNAINQIEKLAQVWKRTVQDQQREFGEENIMKYQEEALRSIDNYYKNALVIFSLPLREKFNNMIERLRESRPNTYFFKDGVFEFGDRFQLPDAHPNKEGHALIAKNLFDYLAKNEIIPCDKPLEMGTIYFEQGKYDKALRAFEKSFAVNPNNEAAILQLAMIYRFLGKYEKSEAMFTRAIAINPNNDFAYVDLGKLYRNWNKYKDAEDMFRKALEINPKSEAAYSYGLGYLYINQKKYAEAEKMFQKALLINPRSEMAYMGLGDVYRETGEYARAENLFQKALEINPKSDAHIGLGYLYLAQQRYKEAEGVFMESFRIRPKSDISLGLGYVYLYQNRYPEAEQMFKKSTEINGRIGGYWELGKLYIAQKRYQDAKDVLKKEIAANPGNNAARNALEQLP